MLIEIAPRLGFRSTAAIEKLGPTFHGRFSLFGQRIELAHPGAKQATRRGTLRMPGADRGRRRAKWAAGEEEEDSETPSYVIKWLQRRRRRQWSVFSLCSRLKACRTHKTPKIGVGFWTRELLSVCFDPREATKRDPNFRLPDPSIIISISGFGAILLIPSRLDAFRRVRGRELGIRGSVLDIIYQH